MAGPLIAVWSPKGGVGKTLIAAGLAMHVARRCAGQAMLIDLDAGKADIAPLLKISPRPSLLDYPVGTGRAVVHPTGLQILPGPTRLVDESLVTGELAARVLERAMTNASTILVDLDSSLRDSTVVTLERANAVLLVTTPDLLSLYAVRRFTQEAAAIEMDLAKFRLVINQTSIRQEIPDSEILSLVGLPLAGRIPSLPGLAAAVNHGMTSTILRSNTEFAVAIHRLAAKLTFAGLPPISVARAAADLLPAGMVPTLKRWWRSL